MLTQPPASKTPAPPSACAAGLYVPENNSLAVELLDTCNCLKILPQLETFENSVFGPDFSIAPQQMRTWAKSGSWLCAAVAGQAVVGRQQVFSMLSILVTTCESRDLLLTGRCSEGELQPWVPTPLNDPPSLYLASVISATADHLALMYESLAQDLRQFRSLWGIKFDSGFSIASGPAGFSHMARNGFRPVEGCTYRDHYPMMVIHPGSAATKFWQDLLGTGGISEAATKIVAYPTAAVAV